ncbi:MAG TPA: hypothetical protein VF139_11725 [Candidatus Polarisedimenticolaceae bacterium]
MRLSCCAIATIALACVPIPAEEPVPLGGPALGMLAQPREAAALAAAGGGLRIRLAAPWSEIEREPGVYDWSRLEPAIAQLEGAGHHVVLALEGANDLHPAGSDGKPPLEPWVAFVRSAVRAFAGKVGTFELGAGPERGGDPAVYAFFLKNAAVAARAEGRAAGAEVRIAQGAVEASGLDVQRAVWSNDTAPYIDVLPVRAGDGPVGETVAAFLAEALLHPPAPALWIYVDAPAGAPPFSTVARAVEALAASAQAVFAAPTSESAAGAEGRWLVGTQARLEPEFSPAPSGGLSIRTPDGAPHDRYRVLGRFFHQKDFRTLVVYDAPLEGADRRTQPQARLVLDTIDVKDPRVLDPTNGADLKTGGVEVPGQSRRALRIVLEDHPLLVVWERAAANVPGLELERQDLEVAGRRGLTAEEILARHRQVQQVQDDRLDRWKGRGRLDYHFKLAQGGSTVDVGIASNYFWERGAALEWEQTDYFINGNPVKWKNIPELPIVQPDKVATLPLDLTLDKKYAYRLLDEDDVDGRPAYVLAFEPEDPEAPLSLYRGRVWIDRETFVRLKTSLVQTNLEPPVLSNEEIDFYRPYTGPDGETYWMLARVEGQQLWTVGGRNLVVTRELAFESLEINPKKPEFAKARDDAYASSNRMLRDTDEGFRYLERQQDGTRTVRATADTSALFAAVGAYKDDASDGVVPLGGVNWFDYDFLKKGWQANIFAAGVVNFVNFTEPSLGGSRVDLTLEGVFFLIKGEEKVFEDGEEVVSQRIQDRNQIVSARLGIPAGQFVKFTVVGTAIVRQYFRDDETDPAFVLPQDHTELRGTFQGEFNRRGWTVRGSVSGSTRSSWEEWGDPAGSEFDPTHESFLQWDAGVFKEWYLPKFQKLRVEANYLGGRDLDRFSRYGFGLFGDDRLNGFAGTGVRFDKGYFARAGYAFNLFGAIRFDLAVDQGRTRDEERDDRWRSFTGAGLSFNVVGPWKTVIAFSYGRALASDLPGLSGKQEFLFTVLKLF